MELCGDMGNRGFGLTGSQEGVSKCNGTNEKVKWKPLSTEDRDKIVPVVSLADELHCCDDGDDGDGPLGDGRVNGGARRMKEWTFSSTNRYYW